MTLKVFIRQQLGTCEGLFADVAVEKHGQLEELSLRYEYFPAIGAPVAATIGAPHSNRERCRSLSFTASPTW